MNILQKTCLKTPVIGVGNLSFGGSGKTLVVQTIAERLISQGLRVGVVCRSYGAESGPHLLTDENSDPAVVGDEAAMIFTSLTSDVGRRTSDVNTYPARIASGRDKTAAAKLLESQVEHLDVILVDDAYQHHKLRQDMKILIWPKPGSILREFKNAADGADVLLVPNGIPSPRPDSETVYFVKEINPYPSRGEGLILLAAGLGPETDFFDQTRKLLRSEAAELRLPDHVDYRDGRVQAKLLRAAEGCDTVWTTAKDDVKLSRLALSLPPIYVVRTRVRFLTNEKVLWNRVDSILNRKKMV